MNSRRFTRSPRSTRMPEYQMWHASTKAFAAAQIAEARDVGCGIMSGPSTAFGAMSLVPSDNRLSCCTAERFSCVPTSDMHFWDGVPAQRSKADIAARLRRDGDGPAGDLWIAAED